MKKNKVLFYSLILAPGEVIGVIKGIKPNDEAETE